jgi:hypothetical protein
MLDGFQGIEDRQDAAPELGRRKPRCPSDVEAGLDVPVREQPRRLREVRAPSHADVPGARDGGEVPEVVRALLAPLGFLDARVRIGAQDHAARIGLAQYIARAPLSLAKLTYLPQEAAVRYSSEFNPAVGDSTKVWTARDFIADATLARLVPPWTARPRAIPGTGFIPPQAVRLIRFFGLYSSRSRWRWPDWQHVARHAPAGWKKTHGGSDAAPAPQPSCTSVPCSSCRSAWAKLIAKV